MPLRTYIGYGEAEAISVGHMLKKVGFSLRLIKISRDVTFKFQFSSGTAAFRVYPLSVPERIMNK